MDFVKMSFSALLQVKGVFLRLARDVVVCQCSLPYDCPKHPPHIQNLIWQLPCHYQVPTATYTISLYISHHCRVVMPLKKMCLHNHKWCGLGFYSSCCILFRTLKKSSVTKSTSTWNLPGVHTESTGSPLQPMAECHLQQEACGC